ncbi:beta-ketoacyl-[acyl-carrier-protein] synthase family protein [Jannaschia sp. Os4]|uniref:beta-ketoacyl-[acyl-carrier-protein] synthase family protein n=1 Tax=Jannaschia sp. Os4 TaxID=2807617 RepID=UPI00193947A5|nr:beta-ketoacyl-[acyl-carrier-protein] synthase family protein [Jannaschia sp. Os4]MBM2577027.1 beta-ketoacyl-[acyl-carrier-protein] synthase family protein [Jannaschia sp. Os4]
MSAGRRVVITGAGTINALGGDVAATRAAMKAGRSAIGPLRVRDADRLSIAVGAQVEGYDPAARFSRQELTLYDPVTQFALIAAAEAMAQAGLAEGGVEPSRAGVILGTSGGGLQTQDENFRLVYEEQRNRVHPFVVPRLMNNAPPAHVSMRYGLTGPSMTVSSACASSNHAIAQAVMTIRAGMADVMVSGGTEAMLCFGGVKAWEGLRVMSSDTCRPFCATRSGMVQGEGAAVVVLEEEAHARARGAPILGEIAGIAMTSDAADIVQPDRAGAVAAMTGALRDAGLDPSDIGYVNAHGTGTAANDRTESAALGDVFGSVPPVSSTKAMHGHCIGATGAIELLAVLMALEEGVIAPTANWREADPDCPVDCVPNAARPATVRAALSNAFAFGGQNAVLAVTAA